MGKKAGSGPEEEKKGGERDEYTGEAHQGLGDRVSLQKSHSVTSDIVKSVRVGTYWV